MDPTLSTPETVAQRQDYVVGLLFYSDYVLLIQKNKPAWQAGMLNGVGGKVEYGEEAVAAMAREFSEEVRLARYGVPDESGEIVPSGWRQFAVLTWRGARVFFYTARLEPGESAAVPFVEDRTDEHVSWWPIARVIERRCDLVIPNLKWLIPLALDKDAVCVQADDPS